MGFSPLKGIKVIEFTHAVMGPSCGMILGDLGAEVVQIEPLMGSPTRRLSGFGSGYYPYFNRNKKSLCLQLKEEKGHEIAKKLIQKSDVVIENFAPGTMERLELSYDKLQKDHPGLVYCSMKGFLDGPYENRSAMDEVVQMMGGLAYMTGPKGKPLRAGSSVVDISGGMFGVIGVMAALLEREQTGKGKYLKSALFETTAFLMGQHMAWSLKAKTPIPPMPERVSAWSIYQVFETKDHPTFVGVISEKHWQAFCSAFQKDQWLKREEFKTNNERIKARELLLPLVKELLAQYSQKEIMSRLEEAKVPFAPIGRPEDLFEDPHLEASGGLVETPFPDSKGGKLPRLPIQWGSERSELQRPPPKAGEHTFEVLSGWLGYEKEALKTLCDNGTIA